MQFVYAASCKNLVGLPAGTELEGLEIRPWKSLAPASSNPLNGAEFVAFPDSESLTKIFIME